MVTRILSVFYKAPSKIIPTLGRWNAHNEKGTFLKIKYANEDNCGVSGNIQNIKKGSDERYIYMMGYESTHK